MTLVYHPEFQALSDSPEGLPEGVIEGTLEEMRDLAEPLYAAMRQLPVAEGVNMTDHAVTTADGASIRLRMYRMNGSEARSAVLYVHGGGMILMGIDEMNSDISRYVSLSGVPFASVEYRLAPDCPRPLAEDAVDAYVWMREHADDLGIDADRIAIMGDSGGGGVAAGAAILLRDRGIPLVKQILVYPMLDDRTRTADPEMEPLLQGWSAKNNVLAWSTVLSERYGTDDVLPCEAPARNRDFKGLAPAFIDVGELDLFRDESIAYAMELMAARVPCELHVLQGLTHVFDTYPIPMAERAFEYRASVIRQL